MNIQLHSVTSTDADCIAVRSLWPSADQEEADYDCVPCPLTHPPPSLELEHRKKAAASNHRTY